MTEDLIRAALIASKAEAVIAAYSGRAYCLISI